MSCEWTKYICKSGQTLFIYNKVTGEHRWPANQNSESIQDHITHGEPMVYKELCNASTQTDDYGCHNGCTSMYIDTNSDILESGAVKVNVNGLDKSNSDENVHRILVNDVRSVQVANAAVSPPSCSTVLESNSQHLNKRKRLINITVVNGKHTNAVDKSSMDNVFTTQQTNASLPPSCTESMASASQEKSVNKRKCSIDTSVSNGNHDPSSDPSLPIITSVSSIRTLNGSSALSYTNNVDGSSQEFNTNKRKCLLDANVIANRNSSHNPGIHRGLPVISNISTIQSFNGNPIASSTNSEKSNSQVRNVNRRKRFLFTNYIPKGKQLVKDNSSDKINNRQATSASSPSSTCSSKSLKTISQERFVHVNVTQSLVNTNLSNGGRNTNVTDKSLTNNVIGSQVSSTQVPSEDHPPTIPKSLGSEGCNNETPQVVIANVFSYATGKVYPTAQDGQKDQLLADNVGIPENGKSTSDCPPKIEKQLVLQGVAPSPQQLLQESIPEHDTEEPVLEEHYSLIAQQLKCGNCNRDFNSKPHLDAHLKVYTGERPFKCSYCDVTFLDNGSLLVHLKMHTRSKPYKCPNCDKAFRYNSSLNVHLKLHSGKKDYKCPSCEKTFHQKIHLRNHLRTHTTELQFKCSDCEEKFKSNSELVVHLLSHSGIRPYKCNFCDRLFSQECHLRCHEQAHGKRKSDKCPYCNKVFKFGSSLTLHIRTHTGERPYKCSQCDLTFRQKQHLIVHVRRHTGEKPFVCQHCGKAFRHDTGLRSHLLIHPESDYSKAQAEMYTAEQLTKKMDE